MSASWPTTILALWVTCGAVGVMIGSWAGEGTWALLIRLMLGPIGIVTALATRTKCPNCGRRIHPQSGFCPHCERKV
jgi:hypothetical protein